MNPPARRDGIPEQGKNEPFYPSYAKPARKQHVKRDKRAKAANEAPNPLDDNWWDDEETKQRRRTPTGSVCKKCSHKQASRRDGTLRL